MTGADFLVSQARALRRAQLLRYASLCMPLAVGLSLLLNARGHSSVVLSGLCFWLLAIVVVDMVRRKVRITRPRLAMWLDREFTALQDSSSLLLSTPSVLTGVATLQRSRIGDVLLNIRADVAQRLAKRLVWLPAFATGLLLCAILANIPQLMHWMSRSAIVPQSAVVGTVSEVLQVQYDVRPPAYMSVAPYSIIGTDVTVAEGADIRVTVTTRGIDALVWYATATDDNVKLYGSNGVFQSEWFKASETTYRLISSGAAMPTSSGEQVHRIALLSDSPPSIELTKPKTRVHSVNSNAPKAIDVLLEATDDFGVSDILMQVTRSEGDGEQVRFVKQSESLWPDDGKAQPATTLRHRLDIQSLGLTKGSELYVNFVALDNRQPEPLRAESATLIIRWPVNDSALDIVLENQIVDVLPEYFRSQRQIIIDTEQLIAEAESVAPNVFAARAQTLAFDQRALRLRYGIFMGEESSGEPSAGATELRGRESEDFPPDDGDHDDHDDHDESETSDDDARQYVGDEGHYVGDGHDHSDEFAVPQSGVGASEFGDSDAAIEPYAHFHDQEEQATIFDPETRDLLRQALSAMWRSEGELRQHTLPPSLPHQYQALALIKKVQNRSRVFVQRIGFEPRPIDFDRRLTGELDELAPFRALPSHPMSQDIMQDAAIKATMAQVLRDDQLPADFSVEPVLAWFNARRTVMQGDDANAARVAFLDAQATLQSWAAQGQCGKCRDSLSSFWREFAPVSTGLPSRQQESLDVFGGVGDEQ